ncbi:MAG: HEAT repeat domain-containing protein [Gemmatimonadota bacterium]|nr:HEAT repeat domain-containing protein [Gemmatimonadota bacterium]
MTVGFLVAVTIFQTVLTVLVVGGLFLGHRSGLRRDRRREDELAVIRECVRRFLAHRLLPEEVIAYLDDVALSSMNAYVHEFAAQTSGTEGEEVVRLLRATRWHRRMLLHARSRFWWRRLAAARALGVVAHAADLLVVHRLLNDPTPATRLAAASALERLPSPALAAAILDRAITGHAVARNHLIEVLAASRTIVLPVLIERLCAPSNDDELRVLLDIGALLGYPTLLQYVIPHANSDAIEVRVATATCLRNFPHPQATNALRRMLTDRSWQVRARAAASLGAVGAAEAIPDLLLSLCDPNWWVRLRSAIALRLVGPAGVEALRRVDGRIDRYAFDMALYVLELDDGAMAEYVGGSATDFATSPSGALAS